MKKIPFNSAVFIKSALVEKDLPNLKAPSGQPMLEIAIVGRSNVGKSSLINHLLNQKQLAKVSATPGKTQLLNFFVIDNQIALVDLPGYGYAKISKETRFEWSDKIEAYLSQRKSLALILFLLDIRRLPSQDDLTFIKWAQYHQKPLLILFTKSDKASLQERERNVSEALKVLSEERSGTFLYQHYSVKDPKARALLIENINRILNTHGTHS